MKVSDIVHSYPTGQNPVGRGQCRVRVFVGAAGTIVLLTDLGPKNDGQSVTNVVEKIIASLLEQGVVIAPDVFIEHYEAEASKFDQFYRVTVVPYKETKWEKISIDDVIHLAECDRQEMDDRSQHNWRISREADRQRFGRNPFADSPWSESTETTRRRLEIIDGMISKATLEKLVLSGASELELQRLLKQDLSFFGESYARPHESYICFSEFPIGDGFVDFAVFTGTSKMDVVLIEIKGANFNLVNNDHYGAFNHKINEATSQISTRLRMIYDDIKSFRASVHGIRKKAQAGHRAYNAFLGPNPDLQVDSKKDINIFSVVIGGRMQNDVEESNKRKDRESGVSPPIRIESWDSWISHLQRQ